MDCKDFFLDGLGRVEETMQMTLAGLTAEQLAFRPAEHANSIGWLAWHLIAASFRAAYAPASMTSVGASAAAPNATMFATDSVPARRSRSW